MNFKVSYVIYILFYKNVKEHIYIIIARCASVSQSVCSSFFWNMSKDRNLIPFATWSDIIGRCPELQTKMFTLSFKFRVSPNVFPRQNHITTKKFWNILNEGYMERYGPTEHRWTIFKNFRPWPRPLPRPKCLKIAFFQLSCKLSSNGSPERYNSGEHICIIFNCFRHQQSY